MISFYKGFFYDKFRVMDEFRGFSNIGIVL